MAETEVVLPPAAPVMEESLGGGRDASPTDRREGRPERPRREPEEIPDMTVEEAHKALNALPKVNVTSLCLCLWFRSEHAIETPGILRSIYYWRDDMIRWVLRLCY